MAYMLKYRLVDGLIEGVWDATPVTYLDAQVEVADTVSGYLFAESALSPLEVLEQHYVHQGEVTPKTVLTLTAAPATFRGDSASQCHVTVSPFTPCRLAVQGRTVDLTADDPVLVLTADRPQW